MISLVDQHLVQLLAECVLGVSVLVFLLSLKFSAWYGRFYTSQSRDRLSISSKLGWFVQECPAFFVPVLIFVSARFAGHSLSLPNQILLCLFLCHYFQRSFIFPFLLRGNKTTPVSLCFLAAMFCLCNGFMQGARLIYGTQHSADWLRDPRFIIGVVLFFSGMFINIQSDHILRNLRKEGQTGYQIPRGGFFEYVSVANYFGEIVEWSGFAVACWNLSALAFAVFTLSFLIPRALQYHRWYTEKFGEDYPKTRKAVIPFVI